MHRIYLGNLTSQVAFYLPYTAGALRAYAETDRIVRETCKFPPFLFHCMDGVECLADTVSEPSVLGLSLYVWNEKKSLKLAKLVKQRYPDCLIVFGGPQVSPNGPRWMNENRFVDILVHHEGERTFLEILREHLSGSGGWDRIDGITFRRGEEVVKTRARTLLKTLEDFPSPYLAGYFDENFEEARRLGRELAAVVETNRGCPYSCTYCDWGSGDYEKIRQFPLAKVLQEIEFLGSRLPEIYVADANFGILPRDLEIARAAVRRAQTGELKTLQVIMAKKKSERTKSIAKLLSDNKLNIFGETVGIQSLTPSVLENVGRQNISLSELDRMLQEYSALGVSSYVELIVGLPGETRATFLATLEKVLQSKAQDVRTYNLILLPNSKLSSPEERARWRFVTENVRITEDRDDESEFNEAVIGTKDMTTEDYRFLRKLVLFVDILHGGKWTYYLAWFLKRESDIPLTKFYQDMLEEFAREESSSSVIGKVASNWFFHRYNGGYFNRFEGPYSPHGVEWSSKFFMKQTYQWLCISECRARFFEEIRGYMTATYPQLEPSLLDDLFKFQSAIMLQPDDKPSRPRILEVDFEWEKFFQTGELAKNRVRYVLRRSSVGRAGIPVSNNDSGWLFEAAGGQFFDKIERFTQIIEGEEPAI